VRAFHKALGRQNVSEGRRISAAQLPHYLKCARLDSRATKVLTSVCKFKFCGLPCCKNIGLLRSRRAIFSSVSQRSKRKNCDRLSSTPDRYRFGSGPDCAAQPADQRTHRAFQDTQERQPFSPRPVKDGLATTEFTRLFEADGHTALPRSRGATWTAPLRYCRLIVWDEQ
jgi:hypothetical protein